jgi:hypothetical protein
VVFSPDARRLYFGAEDVLQVDVIDMPARRQIPSIAVVRRRASAHGVRAGQPDIRILFQ